MLLKNILLFFVSLCTFSALASAACPVANGTYVMYNLIQPNAVATADDATVGSQMYLETYSSGSTHQEYVLVNTSIVGSNCYYTIKNSYSGLYLENVSGAFDQESQNFADNQEWLITAACCGTGVVTIKSKSDGKSLEVKDSSGITWPTWKLQ